MLKALWFMAKIALVVGICIWVAERPGSVSIDWLEYRFTLKMGFFLLTCIAAILISLTLYSIIHALLRMPQGIKRHREMQRKVKGYKALTLGLTAVAAGDKKAAHYQAARATGFLPEDQGLPLLLEAQSARLDGREEDAQENFYALMNNKDTAFLGIRGLLQTALDENNHEQALQLARKAHDLNPKQSWVLKIRYNLEIKSREWNDARKTLKRAERIKAFPTDKITSDRVAIALAHAEELLQNGESKEAFTEIKRAYKLAPNFVPASSAMAQHYIEQNNRARAVQIIERAWKSGDHPDLLELWDRVMPTKRAKNPLARLKWYERLLTINPQSAQGLLAIAEVAIHDGLWGEARSYLDRAEEICITSKLYELRAALERKSGSGDELAIEKYLKMAQTTEAEPVWVCSETGRIYNSWSPIALPHNSFNTIIWDLPQNWLLSETLISSSGAQNISILEAPKA